MKDLRIRSEVIDHTIFQIAAGIPLPFPFDKTSIDCIISAIPLSARRMIEIGNFNGAVARSIAARNPQLHYHVLRDDPDQIRLAQNADLTVIEGNLNARKPPNCDGFDVVLVGALLDGVENSAQLIRRAARMLAPGGTLLTLLPNPHRWERLPDVLSGNGDPSPFDLSRFAAVLDKAGLREHRRLDIARSAPADMRTDPVRSAIKALAAAVGHDVDTVEGNLSRLATLSVARREPKTAPAPLHFHQIVMVQKLMHVRNELPVNALLSESDLTVSSAFRQFDNIPDLPIDAPKVLVLQRARFNEPRAAARMMAQLTVRGWIAVVEFDDDPELVMRIHPQRTMDNYVPQMQAAHAVQTSTERLRQKFLPHNPEVRAFANALLVLPRPRKRPADRPVRIFFGALNREGYSADFARALAPAIAAHPEIEFEVVVDQSFFDALPTERKRLHPLLPYDKYLTLMGDCDIALSPLRGCEAELGKSDLKFVEAASRETATLASPAVYADTIRDGENGLIAATLEDWPAQLIRLVGDAGLRRRISQNARDHVRDHRMLSHQIMARKDWYFALWSRRDALTRAAVERSPLLREELAQRGVRFG